MIKLFCMKTKYLFTIPFLFLAIPFAHPQCKNYAKKNCVPSLKPFVVNGKMNSSNFRPGDHAELIMTFNSGIEYRLMICNMEQINVSFQLIDDNNKVYFDSKTAKKNYFDFKVASTQQLTISVICEDKEGLTGITPEGCVAILTGYKPKKED